MILNTLQFDSIFTALSVGAVMKYWIWNWLSRKFNNLAVPAGKVTMLTIYPVKSCQGVSIPYALFTNLGLKYEGVFDRSWGFVCEDGSPYNLKKCRKLVQIKPSFHGDQLFLEAPNMITLKLPINRSSQPLIGDEPSGKSSLKNNIVVCNYAGDEFEAYDCGSSTHSWIRQFTGDDSVRMVFCDESLRKRVQGNCKKKFHDLNRPFDQVGLASNSSYHLLTEPTIADLGPYYQESNTSVDIGVFRANVILSGTKPYDEDNWETICFGSTARIRQTKQTHRCFFIDVNSKTGEQKEGLLKYLKKHRTVRKDLYGNSPIIGINCNLDFGGIVRVGDPVFASPLSLKYN